MLELSLSRLLGNQLSDGDFWKLFYSCGVMTNSENGGRRT